MKSVELADQYLSYYSLLRKSVKWTKKIIMFFVHCALFNSFIIYRKLNSHVKINFDNYMQTVATEWIGYDRETSDPDNDYLPMNSLRERIPHNDPPQRLSGDIKTHYLEKIQSSRSKKNPQKRCRICKINRKRIDTSFICKSCRIPLCKDTCFQTYHTKEKY